MADDNSTVRCCTDPSFDAQTDYGLVVGNARNFLERRRLIITNRRPRPRLELGRFRALNLPVAAPLPLPELLGHLNGEPPPDRAVTQEWPHPSTGGES